MAEKLSGKIKDFLFGGLREDDFEDDEYFDEENVSQTPILSKSSSNKVVNINPNQHQMKVVIYEPTSYDDAPIIVDSLKNRRAVVVNLENIQDPEVSKTIFHFLNGAIYAMDGDIRKISKGIFVIAPSNIDIDGNIKKELESKGLFRW